MQSPPGKRAEQDAQPRFHGWAPKVPMKALIVYKIVHMYRWRRVVRKGFVALIRFSKGFMNQKMLKDFGVEHAF